MEPLDKLPNLCPIVQEPQIASAEAPWIRNVKKITTEPSESSNLRFVATVVVGIVALSLMLPA